MEQQKCFVCDRIQQIHEKSNPYFVAELKTGYVVLGDHQYFKGYTLFLCKEHKTELQYLEEGFRIEFMTQMSKVAEAVYHAFLPDKLNYELLGNGLGGAHMHWHIFPRREKDLCIPGPVWKLPQEIMYSEETKPSEAELKDMKLRLLLELEKLTDIYYKSEL